jgi:hypothetical protein
VAVVENLSAYLAAFGVAATLDGRAVSVLMLNEYVRMLDVGSREIGAGLPSAAAGNATRGSVLVVGSGTYKVRAVEPDGTGWTVLVLEL